MSRKNPPIVRRPLADVGGRLLLDLDRGPDFLELLLDVGGLLLGHALLHQLGRAIDESSCRRPR
jgi:hypothetical protein